MEIYFKHELGSSSIQVQQIEIVVDSTKLDIIVTHF